MHYILLGIGASVIFGIWLWAYYRNRVPLQSFIVGGIKINKDGIDAISPSYIARIISFYPRAIEELDIGIERHKITEMLIESTWTFKPHFVFRRRFQRGKRIWVPWSNALGTYKIFHLLHHMIDEVILHKPYDKKHLNEKWWDILGEICSKWDKEYDGTSR